MPVIQAPVRLTQLSISLSLPLCLCPWENNPSRTGKQLFGDDEKRTEIVIRRMAEERADRMKKEVTTWLTWLVLT